MRRRALAVGLISGLLLMGGFNPGPAEVATIEILCQESEGGGAFTGTTPDGTIFLADPNPSLPSTGTGVFEPFVRIQRSTGGGGGLQNGTGFTGTPFTGPNGLLGLQPIWALDSALNGDVDVVLQASICDTPGQGGSGHGDLGVFIPSTLLSGNPDDYFVFYSEYARANDGFEEWRFNSAGAPIPEPATLILLGSGLIGLASWARRRALR